VLINNAGLSDEGPFDGPDAIDRLERVMATNFLGAAYVTAELMRCCLRRRRRT
jgi:NAD(P)-dependent dehydrogenase (short-subunit alcohol dehydrogenase family)